MKSFGQNNINLVRLVIGEENNEASWYYILLDRLKVAIYECEVKKDNINLLKFGRIILSGWGLEPPEDVKAQIKEQFA